ncbi:glycosyltransferase [Arthrobacter sp. 260]|uniref:glycosyltransferase n=1 Tax=Arthrobacter sp. 260 TaxID=2735314 RepID=UPI0014913303|nr:glycosyltransferase [Arthrobacter sp. 260]NOJ60398.1 glycosyltransferase [Arthrobacter sp. 260]
MQFDDERRTRSPIDAARRSKYLADIDKFIDEHEVLQRSHKRDANSIRSLRTQLTGVERTNTELTTRIKSLEGENKALRTSLSALRKSSRLRIGTAVTAPARALTRLKAPVENILKRQTPVAPSAVETTLSRPLNPIERANELRELLSRAPSKGNAHNLIAHLYFVLGAVSEPAAVIERYEEVLTDLTPKERQLIEAVRGLNRLQKRPIVLPPEQGSPGYQPERGRMLYCAHSVSPYNSNGYSTRTAGIVNGLAAAGADVVIAARPGYPWDIKTDKAPSSDVSYTETIAGITHFFSHGPTWTQSPLDHFIQQAADSYVQIAIRNRVERIQAASNHVTALPALIAARRLGLPFIYEVRGLWEITESSTKPNWGQSDRYNFSKDMETLVAASADSVFAITPQVMDELIQRGVPAEKISVLPNAVDTDDFSDMPQHRPTRTRLGLEDDAPVIGYAGSLVEYEGLGTLLEAFRTLILKDIRVHLVIVGDGAALPKLKHQAKQLGIADYVKFTGRIAAEEIPALISVFDIMPCPRMPLPITEMVSPLKPLEGMAAGKAVVLSDLAPMRDLAGEDGERARLFQAGDPGALARVLEDLLNDPTQRQEMGRRARLWAVAERTWKKVGEVAWSSRESTQTTASESARNLSSLTLGIIADEFTTAGLRPEINLVEVHPDRWQAELDSNPIDAMFVESAWDGNEGSWRGKVGYYDDESFADLLALLTYCRERSIPTIFWNKEDPVHFNRFRQTARHFDHVFTSDDGSIPGYLQSAGPSLVSVASLPFYAQPKLHNPLPSLRPYSHTVSYAGSYYGDRYKKRSDQLHALLAAALPSGLTIYDRQHLNPDSPYKFPPDLAPHVSGGLPYAEMLEAYKAHPVHVNVNSVEQSGTMFSRRVFEVAACGGAVISGPGLGIERVFGSVIPIAQDQRSAHALINYWMENEDARNEDAWLGMRSVFRSHTAAHRLTYVLRTAGLEIVAPALEKYALRVSNPTQETIEQLEAQSVRPALILMDSEANPNRVVNGMAGEGAMNLSLEALLTAGITLIGDVPSGPIDRTFYEDLLTSRKYLAWDSARIESSHTNEPGWGLARPAPHEDVAGRHLEALVAKGTGSLILNRRVTASSSAAAQQRVKPAAKRILVAGHDLKFARGLISYLEDAGHTIEIDQWLGHSQHDETGSRAKLATADIIFCEWALGNAVWYANNKRQDQRLVCRLHLQELTTPYLSQLNTHNVDQFIFVGRHIADVAERDFDIPAKKSQVIPNYVDTKRLHRDKKPGANWNIGLVGIVPQRKRLDLALDVLRGLRRSDRRYHLFIKGKRPEDFPWMADRPEELAYYLEQYQRIENDPLLSGAVTFDPQGDDMAEWYRKIGTVLSMSDFESFHLTLADGAASGALPATLAWSGADQIYPVSWISASVESLTKRVASMAADEPMRTAAVINARKFVEEHFDQSQVLQNLLESILKE